MDKPTTEPVREATAPLDFIRTIVADDVKAGKLGGRVATRFPPEPNGYLHIGHAKSICLNFGVAAEFGGTCNLRFDDTNPTKEDVEYVDSIQEDVRWLGFSWHERPLYASDYFERLYEYAQHLIGKGLAYVDSLTADEIRAHRGTLTEPGTASPYRDRPVDESLDLFARMRAGEFPDGALVLRAKIDMASPNINLRDPVLYRIRRAHHHRTGDAWCIYPMYDFAHPPSDALEHITHSLCTLEFEDHRPLYDWLIEHLPVPSQPRQIRAAMSARRSGSTSGAVSAVDMSLKVALRSVRMSEPSATVTVKKEMFPSTMPSATTSPLVRHHRYTVCFETPARTAICSMLSASQPTSTSRSRVAFKIATRFDSLRGRPRGVLTIDEW